MKFGERGEHGALVVTVRDDASIEIESVPIARTRLLDVTIPIDDAADEGAVIAACERALASFGKNDYVRATLRGTVQPGTRVDRALLTERCGARPRCARSDRPQRRSPITPRSRTNRTCAAGRWRNCWRPPTAATTMRAARWRWS